MRACRQAVIILGMHRSGTSAVAGAVSLLGAMPPARLLPATSENPTGYFESPTIIRVNDRILMAGQATWYDCLGFDCNAFDARTRATASAFITGSVMAEFADSPLLLIKDPRISLLLDLWLPPLREMLVLPVVLLVLRHPCEVMESLARRDALPTQLAMALWLHYMLQAESASRQCPRYVLPYERLLSDWRSSLQRVGLAASIAWPVAFDFVAPSMETLLRRELRHHYACASAQQNVGSPLGHWADEVYQSLLVLAAQSDDLWSLQRIDRVREEFREWCHVHGRAWSAALLTGHSILARQRGSELPIAWEDIASRSL